ncbi:MAG: hypothetical protein JJE40_04755 [Vicinamibacteria bacterium]|nr:hypothetical protein [Vicinamibacteria bacterium]
MLRRRARLAIFFTLTLALTPAPALAQAAAAAPGQAESAKIWLDQRTQIEEYMKTAEIVSMEELKVGVTRPKRAMLAPGGLVGSIAFKNVPPGRPSGFWESYKSEIAAYELDKVLGLDMVPPTVEKRVKGDKGAAVMWCSPTKSFKDLGGVPSAPPAHFASWNRQLAKAKMFDNLIGNMDPNLGNWLVDPAWNLILIDHTRAFTADKAMVHKKMDRIDGELWDKMKALTVESLTPLLSPWIGKGEIKAVIQRRDVMAADYDKLMAANPAFVIR